MGIKTEEIPVYTLGHFTANTKSFLADGLTQLLERWPILEHPHRHSFYMLIYVEEATGTAVIDNHSVRLEKSKVICIRPNSVFSLDINRHAKGSVLCFTEQFFSLRYNNNVLYQFSFLKKGAGSFIRLPGPQTEKWDMLLSLILQEYRQQQAGADKVIRSYLNILLFDFDRCIQPGSTKEMYGSKGEKIVQFEKLLEEHYGLHKTPSFYAGRLHITTNYLNRLCKQALGVTSGEVIRRRIAIEAQRLLHYTTLSVSEVAYKLGFESPSYFVTFFKKETETTPECFRKKNA